MVVRPIGSVLAMVVGLAAVAHAQPKTLPPLEGATELLKVSPGTGFVDDVATGDADRFAFVVTDGSATAELHVTTLSTKKEQTFSVAGVTLRPVALRLVGSRAFVVGRGDDGQYVAGLVPLVEKAKLVYKIAPANHITIIVRDGKPRVAVHRVWMTKAAGTRHTVELLALETGARIGPARTLELDSTGTNKKLDFHVNHWRDGFTRATGTKGGEWDRKENQRTPDVEATFDLVANKIVDRQPIKDLFEQRKRFTVLAAANELGDFIHYTEKRDALELWRNGKARTLELDQPLTSYDPASLVGYVGADGSAWLALQIDPVNAAAVARKKADPEYLDIFQAPLDGKATRKARVLATKTRFRFGPAGADRFYVIERNQSIERGGKAVTLYKLQ